MSFQKMVRLIVGIVVVLVVTNAIAAHEEETRLGKRAYEDQSVADLNDAAMARISAAQRNFYRTNGYDNSIIRRSSGENDAGIDAVFPAIDRYR